MSDDTEYEKVILPHKLSIVMPRRSCLNVWDNPNCDDDRPPMVDYPRYSSAGSSYSDMHNWDLKIPGEHTIEGESFDAEIQMFHTHLSDRRLSSIGIPIRATPDGYSSAFQFILNEFQDVYDYNQMVCQNRRTRQRRQLKQQSRNFLRRQLQKLQQQPKDKDSQEGGISVEKKTTANTSTVDAATPTTVFDDDYLYYYNDEYYNNVTRQEAAAATLNVYANSTTTTGTATTQQRHRHLLSNKFDPYSDDFMTTMFFYRYDGSITEPPCIDISWWVMNQPMNISTRQLHQAKTLLFTNVDPQQGCRKTSVHNRDQSVARPIQPLGNDREIQHCHEGDFRSDLSKGRGPAKRCR